MASDTPFRKAMVISDTCEFRGARTRRGEAALRATVLFVALVVGGAIACSTNGPSNDGGTGACTQPTTAINGTIRGLPFSEGSATAKWSPSGKTLAVELDSWTEDCAHTKSIPSNGTSVNIQVPRALFAVGAYQAAAATFAVDPSAIVIYTGAYPGDDSGVTSQFMDALTGGSVWITSASDTSVSGAVCFGDPSHQTTVTGTFTATVCASADGGAIDAAQD